MLKKGTDAIAGLPHEKFKKAIDKGHDVLEKRKAKIGDAVESDPRKAELRDAVSTLKEKRKTHQTTYVTPVYEVQEPVQVQVQTRRGKGRQRKKAGTHIESHGQLPKFKMETAAAVPRTAGYSIPLATPGETAKLKKYIPNREAMDKAAVEIGKRKELFPWDFHADGCYARAQMMLQHLYLMGIPEENLGRTYLLFPAGKNWGYHVAPIVKLNTGEWVVIDPAMNEEGASTLDEWANYMGDGTVKLGQKHLRDGDTFNYDSSKYNLFTVDFHTNMYSLDTAAGTASLTKESNAGLYSNLHVLGKYRGEEVDVPYIDEQLPTT